MQLSNMLAPIGSRQLAPAGRDGMKAVVWDKHKIRFQTDEQGTVWFLYLDACKALGVVNPSETKRNLLKGISGSAGLAEEYFKRTPFENARKQIRKNGWLIHEELVWGRLIARSNKASAFKMQQWIGKVIRQVLHTGRYSLRQSQQLIEEKSAEIVALQRENGDLVDDNDGLEDANNDLEQENADLRELGCFDNIIRLRALRYDPNVHYRPICALCRHLIEAGHAHWARFGLKPKPYFRSHTALQASLATIRAWVIPADAGFGFV